MGECHVFSLPEKYASKLLPLSRKEAWFIPVSNPSLDMIVACEAGRTLVPTKPYLVENKLMVKPFLLIAVSLKQRWMVAAQK